MEPATVHVTFGPSRADSIAAALRVQGCGDRVIGLPAALDMGPIDPPDPDTRFRWIGTVLRADPAWHVRESEAEWAEATAPGILPVYWVCFTDAAEHACFGEFASRMADRPFDVVDATGLAFTTRDGVRSPGSLGLMRPEDILGAGLPARRRPFAQAERDATRAAWARLRAEDAPFRVLEDGRLVSAPLDVFDPVLLEAAGPGWEVAARLVGRAMHGLTFGRHRGVSDTALFGRMLALAEAGALEVRGPGPGMRDYEVRLAARG